MEKYNWKKEALDWLGSQPKVQGFKKDLLEIFEKAFSNTSVPDKALFGSNNFALSLLTGNTYFIAYVRSGMFYLLVDKYFDDIPNSTIYLVKNTKNLPNPIYWFSTDDLTNLKVLISRSDIWDSYRKATSRIYESHRAIAYRKDRAINKQILSDFYYESAYQTLKEVEDEFTEKVNKARSLSRSKRRSLLKSAKSVPVKRVVTSFVYNRSPYVVAEALERAQGFCESCKKPAPFLKRVDNTPYLEVHHKKPLSEGGLDTLDNVTALCPNCHREVHDILRN